MLGLPFGLTNYVKVEVHHPLQGEPASTLLLVQSLCLAVFLALGCDLWCLPPLGVSCYPQRGYVAIKAVYQIHLYPLCPLFHLLGNLM